MSISFLMDLAIHGAQFLLHIRSSSEHDNRGHWIVNWKQKPCHQHHQTIIRSSLNAKKVKLLERMSGDGFWRVDQGQTNQWTGQWVSVQKWGSENRGVGDRDIKLMQCEMVRHRTPCFRITSWLGNRAGHWVRGDEILKRLIERLGWVKSVYVEISTSYYMIVRQ